MVLEFLMSTSNRKLCRDPIWSAWLGFPSASDFQVLFTLSKFVQFACEALDKNQNRARFPVVPESKGGGGGEGEEKKLVRILIREKVKY